MSRGSCPVYRSGVWPGDVAPQAPCTPRSPGPSPARPPPPFSLRLASASGSFESFFGTRRYSISVGPYSLGRPSGPRLPQRGRRESPAVPVAPPAARSPTRRVLPTPVSVSFPFVLRGRRRGLGTFGLSFPSGRGSPPSPSPLSPSLEEVPGPGPLLSSPKLRRLVTPNERWEFIFVYSGQLTPRPPPPSPPPPPDLTNELWVLLSGARSPTARVGRGAVEKEFKRGKDGEPEWVRDGGSGPAHVSLVGVRTGVGTKVSPGRPTSLTESKRDGKSRPRTPVRGRQTPRTPQFSTHVVSLPST